MARKQAYFISPHLDDAAFSAGALMSHLAKISQVTVATVFTKGGKSNTLSARQFLKQNNSADSRSLYRLRRLEDTNALSRAGIKAIHLGYTDALWRTIASRRSLLIPELKAVYPTYRLHITRGVVSAHDTELIKQISARLKKLVKGEKALIFCPVGHGHIDHLVTRLACERAFGVARLTYWLDFPYSQRTAFDSTRYTEIFPAKLRRGDYTAKLKLSQSYHSQYPLVITTDQQLTRTNETYYRPIFTPIQSLVPAHHSGNYAFALIQLATGKQLFTKALVSGHSLRKRKWLVNEQNVYSALSNIARLSSLTRRLKLYIPKSYARLPGQSGTTLNLEYLPGKTIARFNPYARADAHNRAVALLSQITPLLDRDDKTSLTSRSPLYWLLSLPYLFIATLLKRRDLAREIVVASGKIISTARYALRRPHSNLIHRDLNFNSFVISNHRLYLIDYQLSALGDPIIDYAVVVNKFIEQRLYIRHLTTSPIFKTRYQSANGPSAFDIYLLILCLYNLLIPHGTHRSSELILRHYYHHNSIIKL